MFYLRGCNVLSNYLLYSMMDINFHKSGNLIFNRKYLYLVLENQIAYLLIDAVPPDQVLYPLLDCHYFIMHHPLVGVVDDLTLLKTTLKIQILNNDMLLNNLSNAGESQFSQNGSTGGIMPFLCFNRSCFGNIVQ